MLKFNKQKMALNKLYAKHRRMAKIVFEENREVYESLGLRQMVYEFLEKYAVNFDLESLVENGDHLFYRKKLKELVHKGSKKAILDGFKSTAGILLNRQ